MVALNNYNPNEWSWEWIPAITQYYLLLDLTYTLLISKHIGVYKNLTQTSYVSIDCLLDYIKKNNVVSVAKFSNQHKPTLKSHDHPLLNLEVNWTLLYSVWRYHRRPMLGGLSASTERTLKRINACLRNSFFFYIYHNYRYFSWNIFAVVFTGSRDRDFREKVITFVAYKTFTNISNISIITKLCI